MARGQPHTPELRAAVLADVLTGCSIRATAAKHHLSRSLVIQWRDEARGITLRQEKRFDFGGLVADYLTEALKTLSAQASFTREKDWLQKQSAGELAILHGVLNDKAVRILAALQDPERRFDARQDD